MVTLKTHQTQKDFSGRVISPTQRPLPNNTEHSRQASTPPVGFEHAIPASERPPTHVLDRVVTATGKCPLSFVKICVAAA